jgi:Predicted hydrolases or acyltransferases (alpha/beta hydrolase superfamily)
MPKKFYQRKRLWLPLIFLAPLLTLIVYLALDPLRNFKNSVNFALRAFDIQERSVRAGKYRLHYYEGGNQNPQTVILLHGFGGNALFSWMQLMPALVKKYHVLAPDLLASNFLALNPKTYSIQAEVQLVRALMDQAGIRQADFVGLSVGGWVSLILALEDPQRVRKLVLIESAGLSMEVPELARLTLDDREKTRRFMNLLFYYPPPLPGFVLDQLIQSSKRIKPKYEAVFMGFIDNSRPFALDEKARAVTQPTLIVHGREDKVIPLEVGERLHDLIPGSEFLILEKSGHGAVWDSPLQLKRAVLNFLALPMPVVTSPESRPSTSPSPPPSPPAPVP